MMTGEEIADQIDFLLKSTPKKTAKELGGLLLGKDDVSPQAMHKRYATLLRQLRKEKIIRELRIVAEYLKVNGEELLFEGEVKVKCLSC